MLAKPTPISYELAKGMATSKRPQSDLFDLFAKQASWSSGLLDLELE
jgi:hypothetical protein